MNRTLAQRRAAYAIARIKEHQQQGNYGNYLSYVEALPAAIHANGLGQAIAMELAAKDEGHKYLASDVSGWLCGSDEAAPYRDFSPTMDPHALLSAIVENNRTSHAWTRKGDQQVMVPLYKGNAAPQTRPNTPHTGLWFDKFYNQWPASFGGLKDVDPDRKRKWLATITASTIGSNQMLQEYADRVRALAKARDGSNLELTNCSRIANGMGNPNPIENGLQWHPTLGVPFLPATSLKGLARAWAALEAEISKNEDTRSNIDRLFGPEDGTDRAAGSV